MNLKEITEKCINLKIYEKRRIEDEYAELVIYNEELDHFNKILESFLGPATKPAGLKPSKDQKKVVAMYGGVSKNQTLFQKDYDNNSIIAMFWPWQDEEHVTLKLAVIDKG